MLDSKTKEYAKIGAIIAGILMSGSSLVNQHNDAQGYDVRMAQMESAVTSIIKRLEKDEDRIDNSSKEIYTMNVQLAQVLVKMDNVIEALRELKNTGGK